MFLEYLCSMSEVAISQRIQSLDARVVDHKHVSLICCFGRANKVAFEHQQTDFHVGEGSYGFSRGPNSWLLMGAVKLTRPQPRAFICRQRRIVSQTEATLLPSDRLTHARWRASLQMTRNHAKLSLCKRRNKRGPSQRLKRLQQAVE